MSDPLFALPSPDWIFVEDLTLRAHTNASVTVDAEGRWEYPSSSETTVRGYFASPSPRDIERAAAAGTVVDAVALVSTATSVSVDDGIDHDGLTYRVTQVRPNPSHTRVLLSRVDTAGPPWHFPES